MSALPEARSLRRVVGFPGLLLYGLGSTVGAGIYVLTGVVAAQAGALAPLAFVLAAGLAAFTALSFAEFSARYPRAGGALVYVREGLRAPALSLVVGLGTASAGMISAATVSLGFVAYFAELLAWPKMLVLPAVVLGVGALAAWGIRESILAAGLVTLVEIGGLLAVLAMGGVHLATSDVPVTLPVFESAAGWSAGIRPIVASAVLCFYAYLGFEDIVNVAEEVRDAPRLMPRAIVLTLVLSALLYVAVSTVSILIVPADALGRAEAPLALVFERAGGSARLMSAIALVAMVNGALVQILMSARILYSLAREGFLPARLAQVGARTQTPVLATGLVSLGVLLLAVALPLERLAALTASVALGVFVLVNVALVRLLQRERRHDHSRRSSSLGGRPLPIAVPMIGALASAVFLVLELFWRPASLG